MSKNKLLLLLVLLLMAVSGAWAQLAITTDLADSYDAKVGSPITLSIEASNAQYYQWYKKYPQGNAMIVGATSSSYAFTPKEAGETKLFCRVLGYNNDYVESKITTVIATVPQTYSVTLKEGTEDEGNWSVPKEAAEGSPVIATYNGTKKVKSVKAVKKALDPAKAYLTWDADQKMLVATEIPTTATKAENANENVSWAGTYVVEDDVTISGTIGLSGDVDLIIKDGATLTAKQIGGSGNNLRIYGQANQSGQLVVNRTNGDAIMNIKTLEVHSAQLTATSSTNSCGGIYGTTTFNVYGGSVDAKGTGAGYGISMNSGGSINIHGGEVKAEGKGTGGYSYGIRCGNTATVTVFGGKLWAGNADKQALTSNINLQKGDGFSGKIEYSSDKSTWSETVDANAKYVRVGY